MAYPGNTNVITQQPGAGGPKQGWTDDGRVQELGLDYLASVDKLFVKQTTEPLEIVTSWETGNKYEILNEHGQKVMYAAEEACCCGMCLCCQKPCKCWRNMKKCLCCCCDREVDLEIFNNAGKKIMHMHRPARCTTCWCPCFLQRMDVEAPPGNRIGSVTQDWSICTPQFSIEDGNGDTILDLDGPFCTSSCCCCGDVEFELKRDGQTVGKVSKKWSGVMKEAFTDADNFGISFPRDLPVHTKATVLASCLLIDFMFFEDEPAKPDDQAPGMCDC